MICPTCRGRGFVPFHETDDLVWHAPCPDCIGAWTITFPSSNEDEKINVAGYRDDKFPEWLCAHCGKPYRGPAVHCSLACALADG
jgi:hypothetical protein